MEPAFHHTVQKRKWSFLKHQRRVKYAANVCERNLFDSVGVESVHVSLELGLLV